MNDEVLLAQMPIDRQTCFSNEKGEPSDKVKARQSKWLLKLWPLLKDKLAKDERILYLAPANDSTAPNLTVAAYLFLFTTVQLIKLPAYLAGGKVQRLIHDLTARDILDFKNRDRIDVETLPYGDLASFEIKGVLNGHLVMMLANGCLEEYIVKDWGDQYKVRSFLHHYVSELQAS
jgi:hypothetical protein